MTLALLVAIGFVAFPAAILFFTIAMTDASDDLIAIAPVSRKQAFMNALRRLLASILASALLAASVLIVRLLAFEWGTRFDGPDTLFAFVGFLMVLFAVGVPMFLVAFSISTKRKARKSAGHENSSRVC